MVMPIYHNLEAKSDLANHIWDANGNISRQSAIDLITKMADRLIATCIRTGADAWDEEKGARVVVETVYGNDEQDYIYVHYLFNCSTGTNNVYDSYNSLPVEEDDPLLITGMIADEGF